MGGASAADRPSQIMITLDVRTKLLGLLVFVLAVSLVRSVWLAAACVGVGLAAALAAGVPPGGLVRRLAWVAYLSAGLFLTFPLVWGRPEGLALAGLASLRIVACLLGALALTASASVPQVLDAMAGLGIPRLFVALCGMTVRYMAVLQGEALRQQVSRRSRCWRPGRFLWSGRTLSTAAHSLGMLLLRAYDRSERIYRSMLSRGYSPVAGVTGIEPAIAGCRAGVAPGEPVAEDAVCVTDLHFRFPDGTPALASVNLRIGRGRRVALMGPNGAGKSTLLLHLNAIHLPQRGSVTVEGLAVSRDTEDAVRRRVGLVFQDPDDQVFSPTVWEDVCFGPLNLGLGKAEVEARAERALAATGLLDMRLRLPQRLSYGQRKRAARTDRAHSVD